MDSGRISTSRTLRCALVFGVAPLLAGCVRQVEEGERLSKSESATLRLESSEDRVWVLSIDGKPTKSLTVLDSYRVAPGRHTATVRSVFYMNPRPIVPGDPHVGTATWDAAAGKRYRISVDVNANAILVVEDK